jgi:hypothetical protein
VFSANGTNAAKNTTATFGQSGSYTFQVTITDAAHLTTTSAVTVAVYESVASLTLSPASDSLINNGTQQFTATLLDQFGKALAGQPPFSWSLTGIGSLSSTGLYTAPSSGTGSATVSAAYGALRKSASVTVTGVSVPATPRGVQMPDPDVPAFGLPPAAPTNLTAIAVSPHQVNLSWVPGGGIATGFEIDRLGPDGNWQEIAEVSPDASTFSDTTVKPNETYQYRVIASGDPGDSPFSNVTQPVRPGARKPDFCAGVIPDLLANMDWKPELDSTLLRFLSRTEKDKRITEP